MYVTDAPCAGCRKILDNSGLDRVVWPAMPSPFGPAPGYATYKFDWVIIGHAWPE